MDEGFRFERNIERNKPPATIFYFFFDMEVYAS